MDKFQPTQLNHSKLSEEDSEEIGDFRVLKLDEGHATQISDFKFGKLKSRKAMAYEEVKTTFGTLAVTDEDRFKRERKDSRFVLNAAAKEGLKIGEEEKRAIEAKVKADVEAMSEEARIRAVQDGFEEGMSRGRAEAYERLYKEGSDLLQRFESAVQKAENLRDDLFKANQRFIMEIIYRMFKMITLKELSMDRDYVLRLAKSLIEKVGARENIRLRVHPEEMASMAKIKDGLEASFGSLKNLQIEASTDIEMGGCELETDWNTIDASVETQFQNLHEALIGKPNSEHTESSA